MIKLKYYKVQMCNLAIAIGSIILKTSIFFLGNAVPKVFAFFNNF